MSSVSAGTALDVVVAIIALYIVAAVTPDRGCRRPLPPQMKSVPPSP